MKTYELTLVGFDIDDSTTDHLVKWVKAPNLEAVNNFVKKQSFQLQESPRHMRGRDNQIHNSEVDYIVDENGNIRQMT
jgi:hypothetical protein